MRRVSLASFLFVFLSQFDAMQVEPDVAECIVESTEQRRTNDLGVTCPHCGRAVVVPGVTARGETPLAECDPCDLYFEVGRNV
jgi:transcription elongation factor Elf1